MLNTYRKYCKKQRQPR